MKILTALAGIIGILGFTALLLQKKFYIPGNLKSFFIFLSGMLVFTIFWFIYLKRREHFWSTLEHELTHALFATLFLKKITSLSASRKKGGLIKIEGGNTVIALAPYFFPLAPFIVLALGLMLPKSLQIYVIFLLGISFQFHFLNLLQELHPGQTDLQIAGYFFSTVIILFFNILFLGIIMAYIADGFGGIHQFIWDGIKSSVYLLFIFYEYFSESLRTRIENF